MKTKRKASGFFIVEILIVLVIVGILVAALLPNLNLYVSRAKFVDVVDAVGAYKPAVEACILQTGTAGSAISTCQQGTNGVPSTITYNSAYVNTVTSASTGVITGTSQGAVGVYTYILTPSYATVGSVSWTQGGTCQAAGLC